MEGFHRKTGEARELLAKEMVILGPQQLFFGEEKRKGFHHAVYLTGALPETFRLAD